MDRITRVSNYKNPDYVQHLVFKAGSIYKAIVLRENFQEKKFKFLLPETKGKFSQVEKSHTTQTEKAMFATCLRGHQRETISLVLRITWGGRALRFLYGKECL